MPRNDIATVAPSSVLASGSSVVSHFIDGAVLRLLSAALGAKPVGALHLTLPSGRRAVVGRGELEEAAHLAVKSYRVLAKTLARGPLGFAESYMAGDVETDDLLGFFDYYMDNDPTLAAAVPGLVRSSWIDRLFHRTRANTRTGSRRNIAAHYDLGNSFYSHWLDAGLTYSSGIYTSPTVTLEAAQEEKYERILAALDLSPDHSLLEIGCGWGQLAETAAARVASVMGITISRQQLEAARTRIERAGLADRADIRLQDYRDLDDLPCF